MRVLNLVPSAFARAGRGLASIAWVFSPVTEPGAPGRLTVYSITLLLIVATLVALAARRLRVPYTVGLVVAGTGLALAHVHTGTALTGHLLFSALLPPLLFEAALSLSWAELRRDALPILTLATAGVVVSALAVAAGMALLMHWPWPAALVFGVLIAATDPVSVLATFKENGVVGRLRLLVEAESLLNDGVAAVLFALAVTYAQGGRRGGTRGLARPSCVSTGGGLAHRRTLRRRGGRAGGAAHRRPPGRDGPDGGGRLRLVPAGRPLPRFRRPGDGGGGPGHGQRRGAARRRLAVLLRAGPRGRHGLLGLRRLRRQLPDLPADRPGQRRRRLPHLGPCAHRRRRRPGLGGPRADRLPALRPVRPLAPADRAAPTSTSCSGAGCAARWLWPWP